MNINNQDSNIPYMELPAPFCYYRYITGNDQMHFGYWPDDEPRTGLHRAQQNLTDLLLSRLPAKTCRILDAGCGLGVTSETLYRQGHEVTAIAPSESMIDYAKSRHPGPDYMVADFMGIHASVSGQTETEYDVIILQESMQYFPDLPALFVKIRRLLAPHGKVLICDEVSYSRHTREKSAVHLMHDIELCLARAGLLVAWHKKAGREVIGTCTEVIFLLQQHLDKMVILFGHDKKEEILALTEGWQQQHDWYSTGKFGYELWELRSDDLVARLYEKGDREKILQLFSRAFHVERSLEHWNWKYLENPFGGPCMVNIWDHGELAAHYAGYAVPLCLDEECISFQIGDTMTNPAYRSRGRGPTSVLARACRLFQRYYGEHQLPLWYGFNTGKIQKFGRLFLKYDIPCPVYEWVADEKNVERLSEMPAWKSLFKGLTTDIVTTFQWADTFFERVRGNYQWLVKRSEQYLQWRFGDHPDHSHTVILLKKWGKVTGYLVIRVEKNEMFIGDALFDPSEPAGFQAAMSAALRHARQKDGILPKVIRAWFSLTPSWWLDIIKANGFIQQREGNHLDLCVTIFDQRISREEVAQKMYFTWGDSDLF